MANPYIRQSSFSDGDTINSALFNDEYDQLVSAFSTSGHTHDGSAGEGAPITKLGPTQDVVVGSSSITPKTNNTVDLGSSSLKFKDAYFSGNVNVDGVVTHSGNMIIGDAATDTLTINATIQGSSLVFEGATANAHELTLAIPDATSDVTVTLPNATDTLVGKATTDTLTNKTLTSAVLNTGVSGTAVLDEDNFASNSATQLATQQSIKAYVDTAILTEDTLAELNDTNITSAADASLLLYDTGTSTWRDASMSGATTISDTGVVTIANDAIDSQHYAAGSIDNEHLAANSVDSSQIASGAVDTAHITDDQVTYAKIQNVSADERILGRVSGANGIIEELTKAQVLTFANVEDGADVTDSTNVVAALTAGTGITISAGGTVAAGPIALTTVQTAANQTAHLALTTEAGDVVVRSDESKTYMHNGGSAGSMLDFTLMATPTDAVTSVGGNTGVVTNAHIAAAVEAASGSNTFTDGDHSKLDGIATSANNYVHPNHSGDVTSTADGATVIGASKVLTSMILDANVTTAKIADDAVTADKLANSINTAIAANTAKTGITSSQASAITANTAKTGITSSQASAITANTAKTGITSSQASAITANTAKTGITSGQASAITANTAKVTNATHSGEVTGATALTIADNIVDEANLKVSNTPTNGYFLSAQSGNTGGMTWAEVDALPSQTSNSGKYLTTNGSAASWATLDTDANTTTKGLYEHAHTIAANYSITSGNNALSAGAVTINSGVSVTIPTGSTWIIA